MLNPEQFLKSLECSNVVVLVVDPQDRIIHASSDFAGLEGQPFTALFPRGERVKAERLLRKARSQKEVSLLFRGSLDSFNDTPLTLLLGPLTEAGGEQPPPAEDAVADHRVADPRVADNVFCMLVNWRGRAQTPEAVGSELLSGVRSIHRLSNRVAAMRLNAEIADQALASDDLSARDVRDTIASITDIARSIEQDLMRLAPYLNVMDGGH